MGRRKRSNKIIIDMDYESIRQKLNNKELKSVFPELRKEVDVAGNWELIDEMESVWTTYQQMLSFSLNGIKDPESVKIRNKICNRLINVVTKLDQLDRVKNRDSERYSKYRKIIGEYYSFNGIVEKLNDISSKIVELKNTDMRQSIQDYNLNNLKEEHESALLNLFYWTWTSSMWKNSDVDTANNFMFSDDIHSDDKSLFVSAVILSVLEYLDRKKILFLLDCYLIDDAQIAQRALVGIVIILYLYHDKLDKGEELVERLKEFCLTSQFVHDMYSVMMQLQISCMTDSISTKMQQDIFPSFMNGRLSKMSKKGFNINDFTKNDENPEWMDDAQFNSKIREITEMQLDGADVYFSTFCSMKGFSFFQQIPHWFYRFNIDSPFTLPEMEKIKNSNVKNMVLLMFSNGQFCNSDKFSLCFLFKDLGGMAENFVESQLSEELNGENINDLMSSPLCDGDKPSIIRRQYINDLYRFYYCYPFRHQFENPFEKMKGKTISPLSNSLFKDLLIDSYEYLNQYAEFLMRKEYYSGALELFELLPKNDIDEKFASLWQRIGFCQQKIGRDYEAMESYKIANALKPNSKWTLRHMAATLFSMSRFDEVIDVYRELLDYDTDNLKYLTNLYTSYYNVRNIDEAIKIAYKVVYLDEGYKTAKEDLAWYLILDKQFEKAENMVNDMIQDNMKVNAALLLSSYLQFIKGNLKDAHVTLSDLVKNGEEFDKIESDFKLLNEFGIIDSNTLILFIDSLFLI